jgi:hypothetical protein
MPFVHFDKDVFTKQTTRLAPPLFSQTTLISTPLRVKDFALLFRLFETFRIFAKATVRPKPCTWQRPKARSGSFSPIKTKVNFTLTITKT